MVVKQKERVTIPVSGMHCAACVSKVESALGDIAGVEQAQANLAAANAAVVCDIEHLSLTEVEKAVRGIGYQVPWERLELLVLGMMGTHCQDRIERAVGDLPGVVRVQVNLATDSVSVEFAASLVSSAQIKRTLREQADGVGRRLRKARLAGTTIHIKLRWSDFTTLTRQTTRPQPTDLDDEIYETALRLFEKNWPPGKAVRLIGVGASGFETPARQLGLWDAQEDQAARSLQSALDELREKFGDDAIRRGSDFAEE